MAAQLRTLFEFIDQSKENMSTGILRRHFSSVMDFCQWTLIFISLAAQIRKMSCDWAYLDYFASLRMKWNPGFVAWSHSDCFDKLIQKQKYYRLWDPLESRFSQEGRKGMRGKNLRGIFPFFFCFSWFLSVSRTLISDWLFVVFAKYISTSSPFLSVPPYHDFFLS